MIQPFRSDHVTVSIPAVKLKRIRIASEAYGEAYDAHQTNPSMTTSMMLTVAEGIMNAAEMNK